MKKIISNILRFDLNCIFSNSPRLVNRVFFGVVFQYPEVPMEITTKKHHFPQKRGGGGGDFLMLRKVMVFLQNNNLVSNIQDRRLRKFATWILKIWIIFHGSVATFVYLHIFSRMQSSYHIITNDFLNQFKINSILA